MKISLKTLAFAASAGMILPVIAQVTPVEDNIEEELDTPLVEDGEELPSQNIVQTAQAAGSFKTLVAALQATGLDTALADAAGSFTVFAPTDLAFEKIGKNQIEYYLSAEGKDELTSILKYHVIPNKVIMSGDIVGSAVKTLQGESLALSVEGENLHVQKAEIVMVDVLASNGVIHAIDKVLMPEMPPRVDEEPTEVVVETETTVVESETIVTDEGVVTETDSSTTVEVEEE